MHYFDRTIGAHCTLRSDCSPRRWSRYRRWFVESLFVVVVVENGNCCQVHRVIHKLQVEIERVEYAGIGGVKCKGELTFEIRGIDAESSTCADQIRCLGGV